MPGFWLSWFGYSVALLVGFALVRPAAATPAPAPDDAPLDLVVVTDHSLSMTRAEYGASDPAGLRFTAAELLTDVLSDRDRLGVVQFSDGATSLAPALVRVGEDGARDQLRKAIRASTTNVQSNTAYRPALSEAGKLILGSASSNKKAVVFLTDGIPTDLVSGVHPDRRLLDDALEPFRTARVPVFLMLLRNPAGFDDPADLEMVRSAFRLTGPEPIELRTPADIAEAFLTVVSRLQPGMYIERLTPIPGSDSTSHFQAHAERDYHISQSTIVVTTASGAMPHILQASNKAPPNARARPANGSGYLVAAYETTDGKPIAGDWSFDVDQADAKGFVVVRADVRYRLRFPAGLPDSIRHYFVAEQPLLIGLQLDGGAAVSPTTRVLARVRPGTCDSGAVGNGTAFETMQRMEPLSGGPLFWLISQPGPGLQALEVHLEGLEDRPITLLITVMTLHRCVHRLARSTSSVRRALKPRRCPISRCLFGLRCRPDYKTRSDSRS